VNIKTNDFVGSQCEY